MELLETIDEFKKLEVFPNKLWKHDKKKDCPNDSDYLFWAGGGTMLNKTCADLLKRFNLGETSLIPLQIYYLDSGELFSEETFYLLNLCEQRRYVTKQPPNKRVKFNPNYLETGTHRCLGELDEDMLEVQKNATECDVDLWHDPWFMNSYFFSERLHNALVKAGLDKKWAMHSCKMV